jgi:single-strand DNA-binding protein
LTKDPELRHTQGGTPVTSFTLAVDRRDKDKTTDFISCVAWNKTAEIINDHCKKGQMIGVSGRLQIRSYTDKEGNKRTAAEIVVDTFDFTGSKEPSDHGCNATQFAVPGSDFAELEDEDGDLPF